MARVQDMWVISKAFKNELEENLKADTSVLCALLVPSILLGLPYKLPYAWSELSLLGEVASRLAFP